MFIIIFGVFSTSKAHAGLFSLIGDLVSGQMGQGPVDGPVYDSASLAVLEAPLSPDPKPAIGGPELLVESGSLVAALSPILSPSETSYQSDEISTYVVREGDTLSEIAKMFGVDTNTIRWANDIKYNNVIRPGQRLTILPIKGVKYTVKKGDTIAKIAKSRKADAQEIANFNKIALNTDLEVGTELLIPDGIDVEFVADQVGRSRLSRSYSNAVSEGYFSHPLSGGRRSQGLHGHNGVDFAARIGTAIRAAASGEVVIARRGYNGGYGNFVALRHPNGTQTLYAHMNSISVSTGDWVTKGTNIGTVGNTGRSTGPHLHFEVRGARNPF